MTSEQQKWVDALRSGKYRQGQKKLCGITKRGREYCCLGVACDIFKEELGLDERENLQLGYVSFNNSSDFLPQVVIEKLRMKDFCGTLEDSDLASENDCGKTFAEIADIIEAHQSELFV